MKDNSEFILRNQNRFNTVYKKGNSKGSRLLVVLYKKNGLPYSRVAYVSSKKVGNSVERNRSRRLMKESYRNIGREIMSGYDIIFVARNSINGTKCDEVKKCMFGVLRACDLFKNNR